MNNEILFFLHIFIMIIFLMITLRLGKFYLIALICIQTVLANLFVIKQIKLFSLTVTSSDVFTIGSVFGLNLLTEYFSKELAKKTIKISFFILFFYLVMSNFHLFYVPAKSDFTQNAFKIIFSSSFRIVSASMFCFFISQHLEVFIYSFLKRKNMKFRMGISPMISQLVDTVLFSFLALFGIVFRIFDVILFSYLIKVVVISCSYPLIVLSKYFYKRDANVQNS